MASLMKSLMDDFHEYSVNERVLENFEAAMMFDNFESFANNCHQMSNEQIFEFMDEKISFMRERNPHMKDVFETIEEIVEYYRS